MAKIEREYKVIAKEIAIAANGISFLTICGKHINGGYAAILNFGIAAELSTDDKSYNSSKIFAALESCSSSYLPSDKERLQALARELSAVITETIASM